MKIGTIQLRRPALILAPMEDVSERPFRRICRQLGADAVVTEFISAEASSLQPFFIYSTLLRYFSLEAGVSFIVLMVARTSWSPSFASQTRPTSTL